MVIIVATVLVRH